PSRRRHTRSKRDWSSDVCSSDLVDVVGKLARNIARSVQFPESSAYMHFIGCVSAAMLGRFTVEYHGTDQPTALYVVTSQPPSTRSEERRVGKGCKYS